MALVLGVKGSRKSGKSTIVELLSAYADMVKRYNVIFLATNPAKDFTLINQIQEKNTINASPAVFQQVLASSTKNNAEELMDYGYKISPSNVVFFDLNSPIMAELEVLEMFNKVLSTVQPDLTLIDVNRESLKDNLQEFILKDGVMSGFIEVVDYNVKDIEEVVEYYLRGEGASLLDRTIFFWNNVPEKQGARYLSKKLGISPNRVYKLPYIEDINIHSFKGDLNNMFDSIFKNKDLTKEFDRFINYLFDVKKTR